MFRHCSRTLITKITGPPKYRFTEVSQRFLLDANKRLSSSSPINKGRRLPHFAWLVGIGGSALGLNELWKKAIAKQNEGNVVLCDAADINLFKKVHLLDSRYEVINRANDAELTEILKTAIGNAYGVAPYHFIILMDWDRLNYRIKSEIDSYPSIDGNRARDDMWESFSVAGFQTPTPNPSGPAQFRQYWLPGEYDVLYCCRLQDGQYKFSIGRGLNVMVDLTFAEDKNKVIRRRPRSITGVSSHRYQSSIATGRKFIVQGPVSEHVSATVMAFRPLCNK